MSLETSITRLQNRLYYISNTDEINENRKKYKRQTWPERADNPANKKPYDYKRWCKHCGEWKEIAYRCDVCGKRLRTRGQISNREVIRI